MLANGFSVTKIQRPLQLDQKPYMMTFIDTFVSKLSKTKTKLEKEISKLIFDSAFRTMCESMCHRSRCDIVTDPKECARIFADPNFT